MPDDGAAAATGAGGTTRRAGGAAGIRSSLRRNRSSGDRAPGTCLRSCEARSGNSRRTVVDTDLARFAGAGTSPTRAGARRVGWSEKKGLKG